MKEEQGEARTSPCFFVHGAAYGNQLLSAARLTKTGIYVCGRLRACFSRAAGSSPLIAMGMPATRRTTASACRASKTQARPMASRASRFGLRERPA